MRIAVSEAKAQLSDLVRRAEAGEEVVLTRHGHPAVRLTALVSKPASEELRARRRGAIDRALADARRRKADGGLGAARSQDYLYDESGLPA